jgi:hypothetical protein
MSPGKSTKLEPKIMEMPPQKMAVVSAKGAPEKVFPVLMPALYGSVYTLKFDLKKKGLPTFKVDGLRARYPGVDPSMKEQWDYIIGLPIPEDTIVLPQKVADIYVMIETWRYGTVAQILHLGYYSEETPSIERLLKFIEDSGYEITGDHEEEYLTKPDAKVVKTIIRYEVKRK